MNQKHQPSIYDKNVNVDLMEQNVIQINGGVMINDGGSVKSIIYVKKIVWNTATCNCENGEYLASIMDDSTAICHEVIESYHEEINFTESKAICKTQISIFYLLF